MMRAGRVLRGSGGSARPKALRSAVGLNSILRFREVQGGHYSGDAQHGTCAAPTPPTLGELLKKVLRAKELVALNTL
eukprot:8663359-Pyramimonas_sp.AAC.1